MKFADFLIGRELIEMSQIRDSPKLLCEGTEIRINAGLEFSGAFHRLRFGFANANVDKFSEHVLQ